MYGLVATKGKEVGTPTKKPWRAAYVNSSLGIRLHAKCDESHIHTPCSGQNTSITEGYTPKIVRIVHECFRDDVRSGNFDVPKYTSASVLMHGNTTHIAAVSRLNLAPTIRAQHRASSPMAANWTEVFDQLDELEKAESANAEVADMAADNEAGDGLPDFEADTEDNVEPGEDEIRAIWTGEEVIEQARFTPDNEAKILLLESIESMEDDKTLYEWFKKAIYLCEFIVPYTKFYYIKMGAITMIVRMLDPEQICGTNVADTVSLRQRCIQATIRFGNIAGELLCLWDTTGIDNKEWAPTSWADDREPCPSFVPFRDAPWVQENPEELEVSYDKEGHVLCAEHPPYHSAEHCPWCQYRKRTPIKEAKTKSPDHINSEAFTPLVYDPLPAFDVLPMYDKWWGNQVGHEGVRLNLKGQYGPLARWRINLRDHYSSLMLLHNPEVFTDRPEMKDWTDSTFIDELRKEQAKDIVNTGLIPASVHKAAIEHY